MLPHLRTVILRGEQAKPKGEIKWACKLKGFKRKKKDDINSKDNKY